MSSTFFYEKDEIFLGVSQSIFKVQKLPFVIGMDQDLFPPPSELNWFIFWNPFLKKRSDFCYLSNLSNN